MIVPSIRRRQRVWRHARLISVLHGSYRTLIERIRRRCTSTILLPLASRQASTTSAGLFATTFAISADRSDPR